MLRIEIHVYSPDTPLFYELLDLLQCEFLRANPCSASQLRRLSSCQSRNWTGPSA